MVYIHCKDNRPRNANYIVLRANVYSRQQIKQEPLINLSKLEQKLSDTQQALQWCAQRRLTKNTFDCLRCQLPCSLTRYAQGIDGCRWACESCGYRKSVRDGSFFARSHLTIRQIVLLVYCWSCDMPQQLMARETEVTDLGAIVDWCNFMREEAEKWLYSNSAEIGGMDANGDPIIVEIDETKYFHRKYHRGQWRDGHWVFGGVERDSGKCFLVIPSKQRQMRPTSSRHVLQSRDHIGFQYAAH